MFDLIVENKILEFAVKNRKGFPWSRSLVHQLIENEKKMLLLRLKHT